MSKKVVVSLFLVLMLMVQTLCPALAEDTACTHEWTTIKTIKEGSCTVKGVYQQECTKCGEKQYVNAYVHNFVEGVIEATCTEPAKVGSQCSVCGLVGEASAVEGSKPLGHDLKVDTTDEEYVEATCEKGGLDTLKCTRCDYTEQKETEKLAHLYDDGVYVEASCEVCEGVKYTCMICGDSYVDPINPDDTPVEHTEEVVDVAATCKTPGVQGRIVCSVCGETLQEGTEVPVDANAHVPTPGKVLKAATCTTAGTRQVVCKECNKTLRYEAYYEDHMWSSERANAEGSCVYKYCTACGAIEIITEFSEPTGCTTKHTLATIPGKAATCTEEGLTAGVKCSVCGEILEAQEPIKATGHSVTVVPGKAATCTETGLTDGEVCSVCDAIVTIQQELPMLDHTVEPIEGKEATCTEAGLTVGEKCSVCGEILKAQEVITMLAHTEEVIPGKAATATETGLSDGIKCAVCGEILKEQEVIPATGCAHQSEVIPGKAATCTETGLTDGEKCAVCGEILKAQEVIPMLAHSEEVIPGKAETCTETGLTAGEKCAVCGEILKAQEVIPMLAHTEEVIPGKAATETETGLTDGVKCSVCGTILKAQEVIPATGCDHTYTVKYSFNSDFTKRVATYTCTKCGDSYSVEEDF